MYEISQLETDQLELDRLETNGHGMNQRDARGYEAHCTAAERHEKAAEQHELAAHSHRTAAEHNEKGDDDGGRWHAERALEFSNRAYQLAQEAHTKSGQIVSL